MRNVKTIAGNPVSEKKKLIKKKKKIDKETCYFITVSHWVHHATISGGLNST